MPTLAANAILLKAPAPVRARAPDEFTGGEGAIVVLGAAAMGMFLGAVLAFVLGRAPAVVTQAALWLLFGIAFKLAAKTFEELVRGRAWSSAALYALHLVAFAPWAFAVLFASPDTGAYWLGLLGVVGVLTAFVAWVLPPARMVYRASAHAALIAGITALQGMFLAFGS
jgi:hypothetical protein